MKTRLLAFLLAGSALAGLGGEAFAQTYRLKAEALVAGDVVRLDHLVDGLGKAGDVPLFAAPAPGQRGTIRAERVLAAAAEFGITGIETGGLHAVAISRQARLLARVDMQEAVRLALVERGLKGDLAVTLDERHAARLTDPARDGKLRVATLSHDARANRFEARLAWGDGDAPENTWLVTGSVEETVEIAVPATNLERGDAIRASDLTVIRRPAAAARGDVMADARELVGMIPRKGLRAGDPIRASDLAKPMLVDKDGLVTVVYRSGGVALSMRGKALGSAAKGETVRVQNTQSKRIIEGTVTGPGQIEVQALPPSPHLAAR